MSFEGASETYEETPPTHFGVSRFAQVASVLALVASALVLVGWAIERRDFQQLFTSNVTVKANTAIGIALLAASLFMSATAARTRRSRVVGVGCAALAATVGALTLAQYVTGLDLGIDQLFVSAAADAAITRTPGRMAATTAGLLAMLGAAFLLHGRSVRSERVSQILFVTATATALTMLLAYAYGAIPTVGLGHGFQIALPTTVALLAISVCGLVLPPHTGWLWTLFSPGVGGITARRLLPFAFAVPLLITTVRLLGPSFGIRHVETLAAAAAVASMLAFAAVIWWTARALEAADRRRADAESERTRLAIEAESERSRAEAEHIQLLVVQEARAVAEEALREKEEMQAKLLHAQKMEAVGQLAGGVAHDFNNLLTVIRSYSSFLEDELPVANEDHRHYAHEIGAAADRAAALTRQLLTFSRKQVVQPRPVHVNEVIGGMESIIARLLPSNIQLEMRLRAAEAVVVIDPGQLEQVLMNLAINARDAMPEGGRLVFESREVVLDEQAARMSAELRSGTYALVEVTDTGHGMDATTRERIFEPFFTTKPVGSGTGLGLSIVYGVIREHGGSVTVYSEPGQGATFKIYLPLTESAARGAVTDTSPVPTGHEVILVVDDDSAVRQAVRESLERFGYTVFDARDGAHALQVSDIFDAQPDLLLTDLMMPQVTGRELVEELQRSGRVPKVLLMSGYTDDEVLRRGLRDARYPFIQKPFTRETLARKVREVLDAARPD